MNLATIEHRIPGTATALVLIIVGASFALSYTALVELALDAGIPVFLAPLWPLCLDAFMAVASLVVLRRALEGQSTLLAWFVVGCITAMSTVFNVIHAPANLVSQAVYAIPPVVVFISFEMLMTLVRMDIGKNSINLKKSYGLAALELESPFLEETKTPKIKTPPRESEPGSDKNLIKFYREHPGASYTDAAVAIGKSRQTARRWVDNLIETGFLVMDEKGAVRVPEGT